MMPTAALPIADCPNKECEGVRPPRAEKTPTLVQNMWWRVRCSSCDYRSPCAATEAEAIRLHNLLCAPAVQATADADDAIKAAAKEICDAIDEDFIMDNFANRINIVAAIIRKAVSPKAAQEACEWSPQNDWGNDSDDRLYNTGCGSEYILNAGNVPGREFSYCPYCGGEASAAASVGKQEKDK